MRPTLLANDMTKNECNEAEAMAAKYEQPLSGLQEQITE
jgi:hypothetical protein